MNEIVYMFFGAFCAMALGFIMQYVKALLFSIIYHYRKRKAKKNEDPDRWVYDI